MKNLIKIIICVMTLYICMSNNTIYAQNNHLYLNITEYEDEHVFSYCDYLYDSITISKDPDCTESIHWCVCYYPGFATTNYYADSITIPFNNTYETVWIWYWGCEVNEKKWTFYPLNFEDVPEPWDNDTAWISLGTTLTLSAPYSPTLNYLWPDGSTDRYYTITGPENSGDIWVEMSNQCGSESDTIGAYYKAEIEMVSVNPFTDQIELTWEVNPYMASYLEALEIYRDNYLIATVPYEDGQYVDEGVYGSVTSRTYKCKSVSKKGFTSPFGSNKPSIHMVYLIDAFNRLVMEANDVSNYYELVQYYVALMQESGEMLIIDSIAAKNGKFVADNNNFEVTRDGILRYTAGMEYINGTGFPVFIANLREGDGKRGKQMYSNVGANEIVGLPEENHDRISIYPNPAQYQITVSDIEEGTITIINSLGQQVLSQEIVGKTTISVNGLSSGIYVAKVITPEGVAYTREFVVK